MAATGTKRDYYDVLGLPRDADAKAVKSAYRRLAVQYHPDKNPGDAAAEARFKEAAEAYAVLSDPERKARYDRFGHRGLGSQPVGFDPETFGDFADILGEFFGVGFGDLFAGGRRRRRGPQPGADLRYELELTLEEAAFGVDKELEIPRLETCEACGGTGGRDGAAPATCATCAGRGQVRVTQGFFALSRPCPQCRGEGSVVADPCPACRGRGQVERRRRLTLKVPPGVDTGTRLRRLGEGEHGRRGGPPGDLYVDIEVLPDERFERQGPDVLSAVEISFPEAVLGTTIEVPTLHGEASLEVPPGTQHGERFRLRRKGIARLDGRGQGDHIVTVHLAVPHPRDLDEEQVEVLVRWAELEGRRVKGPRKVLDRVRDLFG
jgi:molecular chaperone DnaJ